MAGMSVVEQMIFDERRDQIRAEAGRITSDLAKMVSNGGHWGHRDHLARKLYELVVDFTDTDQFRVNFMFSIATEIKQRLEVAEQARATGDENVRLREERAAEEKRTREDIYKLVEAVGKLRQDVDWHQDNIEDLRGAIFEDQSGGE
jgi:hypothetical protein